MATSIHSYNLNLAIKDTDSTEIKAMLKTLQIERESSMEASCRVPEQITATLLNQDRLDGTDCSDEKSTTVGSAETYSSATDNFESSNTSISTDMNNTTP